MKVSPAQQSVHHTQLIKIWSVFAPRTIFVFVDVVAIPPTV